MVTAPYLHKLESEMTAEFPQWHLRTWSRPRVTTLGMRIYVPRDWETRSDAAKYRTLRHERQHMRQYARLGFGHPNWGIPLYLLCYVLLFLPLGFAVFRYYWEREAFLESLRARAEVQGQSNALAAIPQYAQKVCGKSYWWPFGGFGIRATERWLRRKLEAQGDTEVFSGFARPKCWR
jgi:hypothetical protein